MENWFAGVMILDEHNRVLVLHFVAPGKGWRIPGGKVNESEDHLYAAIREVREEVGLNLVPANCREIGKHIIDVDGTIWHGTIYMTRTWNGTPTIKEPHKHNAIAYMEPGLLKTLNPVLACDVEMLERVLKPDDQIGESN